VQRARAALLGTLTTVGLEAEQLQDDGQGDGGADGVEVDGGTRRGRWLSRRPLWLRLALLPALFAGLGQFAIAFGMDLLVASFEFVLGGDVTDGAVQADGVVVVDIIGDENTGLVEGQWHLDADALALEGFVPAFDLAIALRIIRRGFDVGHTSDADELLEFLGDELGAVVADDAWFGVGVGLAGALDDGLHVGFLHFLADFPVDDEATVAIEDGAEEVERASDVEVTDIDVPVFVGLERLDEAGAFPGDVGRGPGQKSGGLEDAVDAGRTASDLVGIEHHEGQATIAFRGMRSRESTDAEFLVVGEPVVAGHPGVVFVDLAEALLPVVELAGADADPGQEATDGDVRLVAPGADEVNDGVAGIVGNPAAV